MSTVTDPRPRRFSIRSAIPAALRLATPSERRRLLLASGLGILGGIAGTALLALSGYLIAKASQAPPILSLTVAIVGVRGFGVVRAAARYAERLVGHDAALGILARLRGDAFAAVADRTEAAGTAVADQLVADVDRVQDAYLRSLAPLAVAVAIGVGGLIATAVLLPIAAGVLAGVLFAGAILLPVQAARMAREAAWRRAPQRAALVREIATALDAAPELIVAGLADAQIARVRHAGAELDRIDQREGRATAFVGAAATAVGGLGAAAVLTVALPVAGSGDLDPVLIGLLPLLVLGVGESIAVLPNAARELQGTADAVGRVSELLGTTDALASAGSPPSRTPTVSGSQPATSLSAAPADALGPHPADAPRPSAPVATLIDATVVLSHVNVRRGGRPVLRDVDLTLVDGERVALVGPSGAGKSTLGELLVGFLPPADVRGAITVGGGPLTDLDPHALRRAILHVPQAPYLFDASLRANLLLARPDADDTQLLKALELVGAGPWCAGLRDGLSTPLGEHGGRLSGGERQRVGLARAVLARNPRLLLLDEPVSHLPPDEGLAVLRALLEHHATAGALVIAHRPAEAALAGRRLHLQADGSLAPAVP